MPCRGSSRRSAGTVLATKPLTVACGEGAVQLLNVVPEGKKPMDGTAFAAGQRLKTGGISSDGGESPRGGSGGAGAAGAGWIFPTLFWMPNSSASSWKAAIKLCQRHLLHGAGTPGHAGLHLCQFLPKGLAKLDAPVREILRAALAQARYMQVPVSAAVNEAVKLTRAF